MKIMFISDIHGIKNNIDIIINKFKKENFDKLVILGDLYYMGFNEINYDAYNNKYIKDKLNEVSDKIICVKGNCDSNIDDVKSNFPIISELGLISTDNLDVYITHGHIYNMDNFNKNNCILVCGHEHIPYIRVKNNTYYINPGSISLPRNNFKPSFMVYENKNFTIMDINNNIIDSININL